MRNLDFWLIAGGILHSLITVLLTVVILSVLREPKRRDGRVATLEHEVDALHDSVKRAVGRLDRSRRPAAASAEADAEAGGTDGAGTLARRPGEDDFAWKKRARLAFASGVKPK